MAESEDRPTGAVRVLVWCRVDETDRESLTAAFDAIGRTLRQVPGYLSSELVQLHSDESRFAVLSAWSDWSRFLAWEQSQVHPEQTSPLRQFQDRSLPRAFEIMTVVGAASN